jgi:hypothetical protein
MTTAEMLQREGETRGKGGIGVVAYLVMSR